jgi:26S proteasome regulatory subunit N1
MVAAKDDTSDMLDFCLKGNQQELHQWGHEYLRSLAGQIGIQYEKRVEKGQPTEDLGALVDIIIPHFIDNNEEPEAVDLLMETENLSKLMKFTNQRNYDRVCRYLCACS